MAVVLGMLDSIISRGLTEFALRQEFEDQYHDYPAQKKILTHSFRLARLFSNVAVRRVKT